jgi:hypothetical protein
MAVSTRLTCKRPAQKGTYVQLMPTKPDSMIAVTGDMDTIPGQFAAAILRHPEKSKGKTIFVAAEFLSFGDMLKIWGEALGRRTVYVETTVESFTNLWGPAGEEMALQFKWGEEMDWSSDLGGGQFVTKEELGIENCVGFRSTIEKLKHFWP